MCEFVAPTTQNTNLRLVVITLLAHIRDLVAFTLAVSLESFTVVCSALTAITGVAAEAERLSTHSTFTLIATLTIQTYIPAFRLLVRTLQDLAVLIYDIAISISQFYPPLRVCGSLRS